MGYTHYTNQKRAFTVAEWEEVTSDIKEILTYVEHGCGIPLANINGEPLTHPTFEAKRIMFNGLGDDAHEGFVIDRKWIRDFEWQDRGSSFCKTANKPYDLAVTACLCYLSSVTETHTVTSDGRGADFVAGLAAAREAIPRKANTLDIPLQIMREDRWTGPWISGTDGSGYEVKFCVNGKAYVHKLAGDEWCCFPTHKDLGRFLNENQRGYEGVEVNIWDASGFFDEARHQRIAKAQGRVLKKLFPTNLTERPPAYIRPGDMPRPEEAAKFSYTLSNLLNRLS